MDHYLRLMRAADRLESDPRSSAAEARSVLAEDPGNGAAAQLLAKALVACGDLPAAGSVLRELREQAPDSAVVRLEFGRWLALQGRLAEAAAEFERALEIEPHLADAWRELSQLHARLGNTLECDSSYARYRQLSRPERTVSDALAARASGNFRQAENLLRARLGKFPDDVTALHALADVLARFEEFGEAEQLLTKCLQLADGFTEARFSLALVFHSQQKPIPMQPLLERLIRFDPDNVDYRVLQSAANTLLGHVDRSLQILEELLARHPSKEQIWVYYGHALRSAGRAAEATAAYRKAIGLAPSFGEAWYSLADLKTGQLTASDIAAMEEQIRRPDLRFEDRVQFDFALGKAHEEHGAYESSFQHYERGNSLWRASARYDARVTTDFVERSERLYSAEFFAARQGWGLPSADPIFIVGLPRSGSTLVEQILASHSQVEGTRELTYVLSSARELGMLGSREAPPTYPQSLAALSREDIVGLASHYLEQAAAHRVLGRPRFIDKMPTNFLHAGLIHLMLPNARIIDVRRDAMACCFSNFRQYYHKGIWFAYSLTDIGLYYRDYVRLMSHFDRVLPGRIHRVRYEDLVSDLETEVRKLLIYCGLPFEEACLRFHENRRAVQTISSEQVRRPLYRDSLEQWRHFERWLDPLRRSLGDLAA